MASSIPRAPVVALRTSIPRACISAWIIRTIESESSTMSTRIGLLSITECDCDARPPCALGALGAIFRPLRRIADLEHRPEAARELRGQEYGQRARAPVRSRLRL